LENSEDRKEEVERGVGTSPTTVAPRDVLRIEDYRKKSCIPIQHMKNLS
jgi:hypothetical protein